MDTEFPKGIGFNDPVLAEEANAQNAIFLLKPLSRKPLLDAILTPEGPPASASND